MRLAFHELGKHLRQPLKPVYVVSGDEPLQHGEACDLIRKTARERGFDERIVLEAGSKFDWQELSAECNALSLFARQRVFDLRIPGGKPGTEGSKALVSYCENPPEDSLLLVSLPKIDQKQARSKWFQALDRAGVTIQVWPVSEQRLGPWIEQRMRHQGLTPEPAAIQLLAEKIEGNLLAASQEIEKLLMLHGPGVITAEQLTASVADSARFDVFALTDAALAGQAGRAMRILSGLNKEGTAPAIIIWALSREIRQMLQIASVLQDGYPQAKVFTDFKIWDKRKPLVSRALKRLSVRQWQHLLGACYQADLAVKGQSKQDCWSLFADLLIAICNPETMQRSPVFQAA